MAQRKPTLEKLACNVFAVDMKNRKKNYYKYAHALSDNELHVMNMGYPFVCTIRLAGSTSDDPRLPNHLGNHHHHSKNTHLLVAGDLRIGRTTSWAEDARLMFGGYDRTPDRSGLINMPPDVCYRGNAGDYGCIFVEGHELLSPTSATRFEDLGQIVRTNKDDPEGFAVTEWVKIEATVGGVKMAWEKQLD